MVGEDHRVLLRFMFSINILACAIAASLAALQPRAFRSQAGLVRQAQRLLPPRTSLANNILKLEVDTHLFAPQVG